MSAGIRILVALLTVSCVVSGQSDEEKEAAEFLKMFDMNATDRIYTYSLASWAYNTNITDENSNKLVRLSTFVTSGSSAHWTILTTLLLDSTVTRQKRGRYGVTSTPKCQKNPVDLIYQKSQMQKLSCSSSPYKTKARAPYLRIKHNEYGCSSSSHYNRNVLFQFYSDNVSVWYLCCSWVRSWMRWTPSTAQPLFASRTTLIPARLWSLVCSVSRQ